MTTASPLLTEDQLYTYRGRVGEFHDGDTCDLDLDLGFGFQLAPFTVTGKRSWSCRIYGINAPELYTIVDHHQVLNQAGVDARDFATSIARPGTIVLVRSVGMDAHSKRFDGIITLPSGDDFAGLMLRAQHAVPFFP